MSAVDCFKLNLNIETVQELKKNIVHLKFSFACKSSQQYIFYYQKQFVEVRKYLNNTLTLK